MKLSLRVKLSAAFITLAVLLFAIIFILSNVFLEKQFKEYTIDKLNQNINDTVALIADRYGVWGRSMEFGGY